MINKIFEKVYMPTIEMADEKIHFQIFAVSNYVTFS